MSAFEALGEEFGAAVQDLTLRQDRQRAEFVADQDRLRHDLETSHKAWVADLEVRLSTALKADLRADVEARFPIALPPVRAPQARATPHPVSVRDGRLATVQQKTAKQLKRYFQDQQTQALRWLRNAYKDADGSDYWNPADFQGQMDAIIVPAVTEAAKQAYLAAAEDFGLAVDWTLNNAFLPLYMGNRLQKIRGIDQTTIDLLTLALTEGAEAGEGMPQLAERVAAVFKDAIGNRADTIARTETITAYGQASLAAYQDAGVMKAQIYDGSYDPECAALNGRVVALDEANQLMADEHPNGTRGVAPVVEPPQLLPDTVTLGAPLSMVTLQAEAFGAVLQKKDARIEQLIEQNREILKTLQLQLANQPQLPDITVEPSPITNNISIPEGAIKVDVRPAEIQKGAISVPVMLPPAPTPPEPKAAPEWNVEFDPDAVEVVMDEDTHTLKVQSLR